MAYILTRKNPIVTETKTGSILTFNSALPVVADDVTSLITGYQEGSGTPAPDNVRNLVSFDECNVSRAGINIWDEVWEVGGITWGTGTNDSSTDKIRSKNYIPVCPNTNYFINIPREGGTYHPTNVFFYDSDKHYISSLFVNVNQSQRTITTPANCYYMRFCPYAAYGTTYNNDISINYPSTDTSYHSGKANKYYTLSFGQSIYEGTIDFTTGVLTATWGYIASYNGETLSGEWISDRDEYVAGNSPTTGAEVAYELATPIEIQLTPTEISLLQGTNNLWSSTGNLTVQFQNVK